MDTLDVFTHTWRVAAADLGFEFTAPFVLQKIRFSGHVPEFGGPKGMLVFSSERFEVQPWARVAEAHGFGWSRLNHGHGAYERQVFIDILNDWGWSRTDRKAPAWYAGKPWTE